MKSKHISSIKEEEKVRYKYMAKQRIGAKTLESNMMMQRSIAATLCPTNTAFHVAK